MTQRDIATEILHSWQQLSRRIAKLTFAEPVHTIYNPYDYAWPAVQQYAKRYGNSTKKTLLVGMNPGPFGMMQTGIPFGEITAVRDWMGISATITPPQTMHPKRPIVGFDIDRSEVSGARLWGWVQAYFGTPAAFFQDFFVINYCPLVFLEAGGRNRTPDKLPAAECNALFDACDASLAECVQILQPGHVLGVGAFAEKRILSALAQLPDTAEIQTGRILHPSPASPIANRGWAPQAEAQLKELGVIT